MEPGDPLRYRLRFFILTLLAVKPSHGYELSKRIEEITGGMIRASPGSMYPLLREMREEGLIEEDLIVESGRAKKVYKLTRRGIEVAAQSLEVAERIMAKMLGLVAEARRRLGEAASGEGGPCPSRELVEGLEYLAKAIGEYLELVKAREKECGG